MQMNKDKKIIGITMGDAAGIGAEVILKALKNITHRRQLKGANFLIIGDSSVIRRTGKALGFSIPLKLIDKPAAVDFSSLPVNLLDMKLRGISAIKPGRPVPACGRASIAYIKEAVGLAKKGRIDAVVTAPISKEMVGRTGLPITGHTEYLARLTRTKDFAMMLIGGGLRVVLVTTHLPLNKVSQSLTRAKIYRTIALANKFLKKYFNIASPRLGVAGFNPHSGEAGLLGREEIDKIEPAVKKARREKMKVSGPVPGDTLFYQAHNGKFDAVIAMYHDQGLIPLKMLAFEQGVNITLGLPFVRTSPDHGTAFDIAGKNLANPASMIEAIKLAVVLAKRHALR